MSITDCNILYLKLVNLGIPKKLAFKIVARKKAATATNCHR